MISKESMQRLHSAIDIEEIIGSFIALKKKGTRYWACCPFHNEKTPSFCVNIESATYKCFGCGESGDAISFLQKIENYSFSEAVKYLSNLYQVELKELTTSTYQEETFTETLYIINELINKFYIENLDTEIKNKSKVYEYLKKRNLNLDHIKDFKIGFSSKEKPIIHKLKQLGYGNETLVKTGLFIDHNDTIQDRFSDRLIFPIYNYSDKISAFAGRLIIENSNQPKYINSPENEIFKKRKTLYGISQAKQTIKKNNKCYLVEGYTDVLAFHICGIKNVIACMGTSLTVEQINAIKRYTNNVVLTFDSDTAGIKASLRGIDLLLTSDFQVNVIPLPIAYDPHSFFMKYGKDYFCDFITKNEIDFLDFKINFLLQQKNNDLFKKAKCINEIIKSLTLINDNVYRLLLTKKCSSLLKISENTIVKEQEKFTLTQSKVQANGRNNIKKNLNSVQSTDNDYLYRKSIEREVFKNFINFFEKKSVPNEIKLSAIQSLCNINFTDEKYLKVLDLLKNNQKTNCTIKELISNADTETKNLIIDLMYEKNEISKKWEISSLVGSDQNVNMLHKNLLKLKLSLTRNLINENIEKLKDSNDINFSYEEIIDNHQNLQKTEKEILQKLETIV